MFCPQCGNEVVENQAFCGHCGARLGAAAPGEVKRIASPWEQRETHGFLNGLVHTAKQVLLRPTDFFKTMRVTGGLTDPLLFALIVGMVGLMFLYFWDILLHDSMRIFMTPGMKSAAGDSLFHGMGMAAAAVFMPFFLIMWLFVVSGMLHLFLMLARGAKSGFEATFRVVCYGVSPFLLLSIPYCGALITIVWSMTLGVIGLKEAHETTGGKAVFTVLFPLIFCCGLGALLMALFMGAIAASFGALMHIHR
jgi:hypothetical protein